MSLFLKFSKLSRPLTSRRVHSAANPEGGFRRAWALIGRPLRWIYWLPLGLGFTQYFYTLKTIRGRSMQPTLNPDTSSWDDIVVFDRYSINSGEPIRKGDVVALRDPLDSRKMIVKRIVAGAGDVVKTLPPYPDAEVFVPEGHVWVEGDEPFRTLDSNKFGPVPLALLDSKLMYIVWPLDRIGPLRPPISPISKRGASRDFRWYSDMAAFEREQRRQSRVTTRSTTTSHS
ncbi:peptidase S24/S26A/S26B/S26C [Suillus subalutaceus]|uniref:peptidase S24/S26A/S26B/S26C n=1 Tax=Suillus subalutaceus TaxID=48586 RepID=UPI001B86771F|nr:peptidase S24/S26A/S26B/S26C [Suillus subalutaceus]KAG1874558.1 peptidase S24/S26A/S26B/S26C [Suillus subalutaceus]